MAKLYLCGIAVLVAFLCCQTAVVYGEIGSSTLPFNVPAPACTGLCVYEYGFQMGTSIPNLTLTPEPSSPGVYPPPTINFALEPSHDRGCYDCLSLFLQEFLQMGILVRT
jgi:hypothetical protein